MVRARVLAMCMRAFVRFSASELRFPSFFMFPLWWFLVLDRLFYRLLCLFFPRGGSEERERWLRSLLYQLNQTRDRGERARKGGREGGGINRPLGRIIRSIGNPRCPPPFCCCVPVRVPVPIEAVVTNVPFGWSGVA